MGISSIVKTWIPHDSLKMALHRFHPGVSQSDWGCVCEMLVDPCFTCLEPTVHVAQKSVVAAARVHQQNENMENLLQPSVAL
jgi:hypothetical protein